MKAKDLEGIPSSILIYGPVGTQKTALVAQASGGYLFDFDGGMKIALTLNDKFKHLRHQIEFDTYVDENPIQPKAWLDARKKLESIVRAVQSKTWKHDAIIADSLTGAAKAIQLYVMSNTGDSFRKPEIQHWGAMIAELERFLILLRACRVLRLITAHELPIERTETRSIIPHLDHTTPLSITRPHSDNRLAWLFDEVWFSSAKLAAMGKTDFVVDGGTSKINRSKSRGGLIKATVHNEIGLAGVLKLIGYSYGKKD